MRNLNQSPTNSGRGKGRGEKKYQLAMKAAIYKDRSGELYSDVDRCTLGRPWVFKVEKL